MAAIEYSCDPARLDIAAIVRFLQQESAWARGESAGRICRALEHSLPFGAYAGPEQVAFARVITDHATFAYLSDVFVLPGWRGQGVGRGLMAAVLAHPDLQDLRHFLLVSREARPFYRTLGFAPLEAPERFMRLARPHVQYRPHP